MVKLNEDAFAAVNAAFPDVAAKDTKARAASSTTSTALKRKGVGASLTSPSQVEGSDLHKRVLQIGSKKQKKQAEEDEEEDFDEHSRSRRAHAGSKTDRHKHQLDEEEEEEDEEDVGRTAINGDSKRVATASSITENLPDSSGKKKKKKKLGKRERQAQKDSNDETVDEKNNDTAPTKQDVLCGVKGKDGTQHPDGEGDDSKKNQKRKRRKVRSRQKNIRKDNRATKPTHLVPGSADYRGRPLTAETRKRLNISESRRSAKLKSYWEGQEKSRGGDDAA